MCRWFAVSTRIMHRRPISCQYGNKNAIFARKRSRIDTQNAQDGDFVSTRLSWCRGQPWWRGQGTTFVAISQLSQVTFQSVAGLQKTADLGHKSATDAFYCRRLAEKCRLAALCPLTCSILIIDLTHYIEGLFGYVWCIGPREKARSAAAVTNRKCQGYQPKMSIIPNSAQCKNPVVFHYHRQRVLRA